MHNNDGNDGTSKAIAVYDKKLQQFYDNVKRQINLDFKHVGKIQKQVKTEDIDATDQRHK